MQGKILFFNIQRLTSNQVNLTTETPGLLALAAYLEPKGYDPLIFQGEPIKAREFLAQQAEENRIQAVGCYCHFENQVEVAQFSREVAEQYGLPVILGGPQVSGFDAEFLKESACLAAVVGEGEITLFKLLECLFNQAGDWRDLNGLLFLGPDGEMVATPHGDVIQDLDELPMPAFHRWVNMPPRQEAQVLTGRGCPFNCAFCHEGSLSRPLRLRSVEKVLEEVEAILENEPGVKYISFTDDIFITNEDRVRRFCQGLSELRERHDFVWFCEGHVKIISRWPGILAEMADAGMVRLQTGIESGVPRVLEAYGKQITPDQVADIISTGYQVGVHQMVGAFITGGPFESHEIVEQNKAFCTRLIELAPGCIELGPSPLMPYPSTRIAQCPEKFGLKLIDPNSMTTFADYPVTETDYLNREQIARAQNDLIRHEVTTMRRVFKEGKVPHERVLQVFKDYAYGVISLWHLVVYSVLPFVKGYYSLLARGAVSRSLDIEHDQLEGWRPQRILEMWHDVDFSAGYARIQGEALSPLEFELLVHSTGKLRLREVLDRVYDKFPGRFDRKEEFDQTAKGLLKSFEDRYWLAYAPL